MRRLTAILCFICFFAIQYGRIMSYWECRLKAASTAAKCECEKIIKIAADKGHISVTGPIKTITEEVYDHAICHLPGHTAVARTTTSFPLTVSPLHEADANGIFQPPRV